MRSQYARTTFLLLTIAFPVFATQSRSFVSSAGLDTNPCTRAQPCRTFAAGIAQTSTYGEVVALDSAGYGPFSLTTSMAIVGAPGVHAGVSVFTGDGVDVATSGGVTVLRNLYVNWQGGANGIVFTTGGWLYVDRCTVNGAFAVGIQVNAATGTNAYVVDTAIRQASQAAFVADGASNLDMTMDRCSLQGSALGNGVVVDRGEIAIRNTVARHNYASFYARGTGGSATLSITSSSSSDDAVGVLVDSGSVVARDVTISNTSTGFHTTTASAMLSVDHSATSGTFYGIDATGGSVTAANSTFANGSIGVLAEMSATVRLTKNTIVANTTGIVNNSATVISTGDNFVDGNGSAATGTVSTVARM